MFRPVPEFIAAVMPTTRSSRSHSRTRASPKTWVYCGGGAFFAPLPLAGLAGEPFTIELGLAACHFSIPSSPPYSAGAKPLPLTVAMCTTTGRSAASASRSARRSALTSWPSITPIGPVELLPPQAGGPERLDRLLQVGTQPLEGGADPDRQLRQAALDVRAGVPQLRVQAHAVEVARERADVGGDRHAVVVEHDHDRRSQAAGLADRLERDATGHGAVADHRDDLGVLSAARLAHALLDTDGVADRGRRVAGAHDVVVGLGDRAERREPFVLADRRERVAAAGEDLVRVGLVADVPEDLVARGVQQRVQRDGQLAGAEVGAEVPADLTDRVDDVLAHLLGERRELLVGELVQVLGAVDVLELAHDVRV